MMTRSICTYRTPARSEPRAAGPGGGPGMPSRASGMQRQHKLTTHPRQQFPPRVFPRAELKMPTSAKSTCSDPLGEIPMPIRSVRSVVANQTPLSIPKTATVLEAAHLMKEHAKGALLVVEGSKLIGIFTERDALFRVIAAGRD